MKISKVVPVGYVDAMFRFQTCQEHHVSPSDRFKPVYTAEQLEAAVLAEREACAKVCETDELCCKCGDECATAIRAINFEGDTGFRPVSEMIAEHKKDPKKAAAIEKAKMRKAARAEKIAMPGVYEEALEHITDGSPCWCNPELNYKDPETGAEVWVHKELQMSNEEIIKAVKNSLNIYSFTAEALEMLIDNAKKEEREKFMAVFEAEYNKYDVLITEEDAGHEEATAIVHLMRKLEAMK